MYYGYGYGIDPTFILLIPAIILSIYAQGKIQSTFNKFSRMRSSTGLTGADAARRILDANGLYNIPIEEIRGNLTDHYDPARKVLRLSENVYYGNSISSIGVAAHEAGHAIQHLEGYIPIKIRNSLVPIANIGSSMSWIFVILGFALGALSFIKIGIVLFSAAVLFQIVTLPVEYNASSRAITLIERYNLLYKDEIVGAKKVLNAAALTYLAATLMAVMQLLRLILISRRRD